MNEAVNDHHDIAQWHVTATSGGWSVRGWHEHSLGTLATPDPAVDVHVSRAVDSAGGDVAQDLAWSIADHLSMEPVRLAADIVALHQGLDGILRMLAVIRKNKPHQGRRAFPGGHLNTGETPEDAALREALEEVTLRFARDDLHPLSIRAAPGRDPRGRYVGFPFLINVPGDEPPVPVAADDAEQAAWVPVDEVLAGVMAFDHKEILLEALAHPAAPRA